MEAEISRPFLDWDVDAVCQWVSNLALSKDYSNVFWSEWINEVELGFQVREYYFRHSDQTFPLFMLTYREGFI